MKQSFKKGQIIPKRIGHFVIHNKARHNLKFNVDCVYEDGKITFDSKKGCLLVLRKKLGRKRKNGTLQLMSLVIHDLHTQDISSPYRPIEM